MPRLPDTVRHLWAYFLELHHRRGHSANGPLAITYQDLEAWERRKGFTLDYWEAEALLRVDDLYLDHVATLLAKETTK